MKISLIIPIYNVEPYVKRCLESVMMQDNADADIECIVVDDCGTDGSMEIVRRIINEYRGKIRFTIIENEQNQGLSVSRNRGLELTTGDYIMFVDSDDYLMSDSLQYFIDNLKLYRDADVLIGNTASEKNSNKELFNIENVCRIDNKDIFLSRLLHHQINAHAWNKLIRRDILTGNHIRFEKGIIYEDILWAYQLFSCLSSIVILPRVTYSYTNNPQSIVNTTFTPAKAEKAVWSYTVSINKMLDMPPDSNRYQKDMTVDYLLYITNYLMNGIDILTKCDVSAKTATEFYQGRNRLMRRSLRLGRILFSAYLLLLYPPFTHLQKFRFFRHHYYDIESVMGRLCHWMDFLHRT